MSQLLQISVPESKLRKLITLAQAGHKPTVEWSASKADMDDQAFKKRGEILAELAKQLAEIVEGEPAEKEVAA